ncbi:hypothetical protein, partial [Burkholderia sp. SIMBA_024]|uniref:hypothetical protein n=1 Tax=Burkholderia sp. SIMBA_024 TaxID=3085768 RepID=UPI00397C9245
SSTFDAGSRMMPSDLKGIGSGRSEYHVPGQPRRLTGDGQAAGIRSRTPVPKSPMSMVVSLVTPGFHLVAR